MTRRPAPIDGRHLRRDQNREAALEALIRLFSQGQYTPTSRQIADRAGLSLRSLTRYFDDFDDLIRSAIERIEQEAMQLVELPIGPDRPTGEKISAIVANRIRLYEAVAPAARAGRICAHRQPAVAEQMARNRQFLQNQVASLFSTEIERSGPELLCSLDVLLSFESYDLLRSAHGMAPAETASVLDASLRLICA